MGEGRFDEIHSKATSSDHNGDVRIGLDSWRSSPSIFDSDCPSFPGWLFVMRNQVQWIRQIIFKCSALTLHTKLQAYPQHKIMSIKRSNTRTSSIIVYSHLSFCHRPLWPLSWPFSPRLLDSETWYSQFEE